jgi:hypothetical protein
MSIIRFSVPEPRDARPAAELDGHTVRLGGEVYTRCLNCQSWQRRWALCPCARGNEEGER